MQSAGGWRESDWFGTFIPYDNGWLYHADLGWLYVVHDGTSGLWAWKKNSGMALDVAGDIPPPLPQRHQGMALLAG